MTARILLSLSDRLHVFWSRSLLNEIPTSVSEILLRLRRRERFCNSLPASKSKLMLIFGEACFSMRVQRDSTSWRSLVEFGIFATLLPITGKVTIDPCDVTLLYKSQYGHDVHAYYGLRARLIGILLSHNPNMAFLPAWWSIYILCGDKHV